MEKHYNCIYMYVNKINGKRYIGQTINFKQRHKQHINKSHNKTPIDKAFNKYGKENFEIIILKENIKDLCTMNLLEYYYINKYETLIKNGKGYNISSGGSNGNNFEGKTEEEIEEWKNKISGAWNNKTKEEQDAIKNKISENHANTKGKNNGMYGKKHSEKTKEKIREKAKGRKSPTKGRKMSEDQRKRLSEIAKNRTDHQKKMVEKLKIKICQYDKNDNLIKIWNSIAEAGDKLNLNKSNISSCCKFWELNGNEEEWFKTKKYYPVKYVGGFKWKYFKE